MPHRSMALALTILLGLLLITIITASLYWNWHNNLSVMELPGSRCTGSGDIFHQSLNGLIDSCHLYCRSSWLIFPTDCAWKSTINTAAIALSPTISIPTAIGELDPLDYPNSGPIPEWHQHRLIDVLLLTLSNLFW